MCLLALSALFLESWFGCHFHEASGASPGSKIFFCGGPNALELCPAGDLAGMSIVGLCFFVTAYCNIPHLYFIFIMVSLGFIVLIEVLYNLLYITGC